MGPLRFGRVGPQCPGLVRGESLVQIVEVADRTPDLVNRLLEVWETSVRATHLFLSDPEIEGIRAYVPQALLGTAHLVVAQDESGAPIAFMGVEDGSLEMLFVAASERGKGVGGRLIRHGIDDYGVERLAFYEHMGFRVCKRTDVDEQGNPYPLLHMKRGSSLS